ncbi:unnamed protein product [Lathyrus sativus]|nr:unnamed protein product [Lathyrus sativus]
MWMNGRGEGENVKCILDRSIATESFINRFSPIKINHLPRYGSDHVTIRIDLEADIFGHGRKERHLFRFEEVWSREPRCEEYVARMWNNDAVRGHRKLVVMQGLDDLFQEYRRSIVSKDIGRIEELMKDKCIWDANLEDIKVYQALENQRNNLLQVEEVILRKRSRVLWLKHGDKNNHFFHGKADQNRKINAITKLKDDNGVW